MVVCLVRRLVVSNLSWITFSSQIFSQNVIDITCGVTSFELEYVLELLADLVIKLNSVT